MKKTTFLIIHIFLSVVSKAQLSVSFTVTDVTCFGGKDGVAIANASGGTAPYTYSWNILPAAAGAQQTITDLSASYYAITVLDANGQQKQDGINVNEPSQIDLSNHFSVDVSCFRCSDASSTIDPSGGISPYAYTWKDGPTDQDRYQLQAGAYEVTVTDANGCSAVQQIVITEPSPDVWLNGGNSNTDPESQFIGTVDEQDLVIKANGEEQMRIKADGGIDVSGDAAFHGGLSIGSTVGIPD